MQFFLDVAAGEDYQHRHYLEDVDITRHRRPFQQIQIHLLQNILQEAVFEFLWSHEQWLALLAPA